MREQDFIREATAGGLGFDGYAFNAEVYCPECGEGIVREMAADVAPTLDGTGDPLFADSETVPQPIFFGESDGPEHCANCGEYLYGEDAPAPGEEDIFIRPDGIAVCLAAGVPCPVPGARYVIVSSVYGARDDRAIKAWCDKKQYWPNVWQEDDHGGRILLAWDEEAGEYKEVHHG